MQIHLYTMCWNESPMLPYFFRHYERIADRIVVYDNCSNDGSQAIIQAHPKAELRMIDTQGQNLQAAMVAVKGRAWQESRRRRLRPLGIPPPILSVMPSEAMPFETVEPADWVIACDVDELLYHPNLRGYLEQCRDTGVTVPLTTGYQMVSDRFPTGCGQIYYEVNRGFPYAEYSKAAVFDPHAVEDMQYRPGCHDCKPIGRVVTHSDPALKLLHFKLLGFEYVVRRYGELGARQPPSERSRGWCWQYHMPEAILRARFEKDLLAARPLELGAA